MTDYPEMQPEVGVRSLDVEAPDSPIRLLHDLIEVNLGSYISTDTGEAGAFVRVAGTITDRNHEDGIDQVPQPLELILSLAQAHGLAHGLVAALKFAEQNSEPPA